ncbi:MAG: M20/M25/M40 family metallo-hydrolase [Candidatus Thorarchaeota archaeon]|jgi:succinyl-diaminopimelate desuccinylase
MTLSALEELKKLVAFDTVNDRKRAEPSPECSRYINEILEQFGFLAEMIESEGHFSAFGRRGQGPFKILFLSHLDTVPVGDGWDSNPFKLRVEGDRAFGRGSCDDKGNIVSLLLLAEKLKERDPPCSVMIAATGDEEAGGRNGAAVLKEYLVKNGLFPDFVVVADGIDQQIIYRRRNILPAALKVKASPKRLRGIQETFRFETETYGSETRHSAYMRPGVDRHAMLVASKYLDLNPYAVVQALRGGFLAARNVVPDWVELDILHPDESSGEVEYDQALTDTMRALLALSQAAFPTKHSDKGKTISPNSLSLEGDLWTLHCDIRAMTNDGESVKQAIQHSLNGKVDVFSLKVLPGAGYVETDPDSFLIRAAKWALKKENIRTRLIEGFGASDSRFFAGAGCELFDFGPRGGNTHGPNEWVSLSSIEENASFFYTLLEVLTRKPDAL